MSVLQDNNLKLIIAVLVMGVIGGSLVGPILPAMLSPLDTSEESVGLVLSVYTFFALVSTPLLGPLADRFGRKTVLVPCTVLFGIAGVMIAFSNLFWLVLALRALQGIGVGGMMNTGVTLIGDLFSGERRAQAMGYRISFQTVTNSFLPFVSGGLATLAWFYPFYIYSLAIPLGVFVGFKLSLNPVASNEEKLPRKTYITQLWKLALHHKSIWVFFSHFMAFFLLFSLVVYMPILIVKHFKLTTLYAGLAISCGAGTAAVVSTQSGRIMRNLSEYLTITVGFLFASLALSLIAIAPSYPAVLCIMVIWGSGFGMLMPTLNTCVTGLASSHLRAGLVSIFTTMLYLGQTVSPLLFGYILSKSDLQTVFRVSGLLALLPVCFALLEYLLWKFGIVNQDSGITNKKCI